MNVEETGTHQTGKVPSFGVPGPRKPPKLGWRHAVARERYLFRVDLYLDGRLPGRQRKRILAELRNSIDAEAESSTLQEILAGLGQPRDLAASYLEGIDRSRPLWAAGGVAAMCALMAYWVLLFTYTLGMLAIADEVGGEFTSHFFFVEVLAFSEGSGIGVGWEGNAALWFPLALAGIAFVAAARGWRVFRRRR
jgi:hypothetical protein